MGWAAAIVAFVYKGMTLTGVGLRVAEATRVAPHHFFEASLLLFVILIAEAAYSWAGRGGPATRSAASKA